MAADSNAQIVESPITEAKIITAVNAARAAVGLSGPIAMTSFNQGRSILITCTSPAYT